jgi:hypothetical protein
VPWVNQYVVELNDIYLRPVVANLVALRGFTPAEDQFAGRLTLSLQ